MKEKFNNLKIKNKNIVIFASGSGSNAVKIHDHFKEIDNVNIASLYCNNPEARVLQKFREFNVKTFLFTKKDLDNQKILESLLKIDPDLIILAGFLLKIPKSITRFFKNKIINIHPALLPLYGGKGMYGKNIHKAVRELLNQMFSLYFLLLLCECFLRTYLYPHITVVKQDEYL